MDTHSDVTIAEEVIVSKIFVIRGKQVMLSGDLAELYQVETRILNQQVKRNLGKFPIRYMFQLTHEEYKRLRSQNVILKRGQHTKYLPCAFTEHGILMLASVLKSEKADSINILIIDTFIKLREILSVHQDVLLQLEQVQNRLSEHDDQFMEIFKYIKEIEKARKQEVLQKSRPRLGFKP